MALKRRAGCAPPWSPAGAKAPPRISVFVADKNENVLAEYKDAVIF